MMQKYDFSKIDQIINDSLDKIGGNAGFAVVHNSELIYTKTFGSMDGDTAVPIASASKWLSAALLMSLVDSGHLSLDNTVEDFFPEFHESKRGISLRMLFAHTSGLPRSNIRVLNRRMKISQIASQINKFELIAAPGKEFHYGSVSMQLGGRIIELAGESNWNYLFERRVTEPLEMTKTHFHAFGGTENPRIGGGAVSSLNDYINFIRMLLNNGKYKTRGILSKNSIHEIHKDQTGNAEIVSTPYNNYKDLVPKDWRDIRYGLGNWVESKEPNSGETLESSSQGAFGFSPWIDWKRRTGCVLVMNNRLRTSIPVYIKLKNAIIEVIDTV